MPPIAFVIVFLASVILARFFSFFSSRSKTPSKGGGKSYACGEDNYDHMAQPDYSTFFPFAFFFTIAHVATLIMATVPAGNALTYILVCLYVICASTGLYVLLRNK